MNSLLIIVTVMFIVQNLILGFVVYIFVQVVEDYKAFHEYYKSVIEQSVPICKQSEKTVMEIKESFNKAKTKSYFQGRNFKYK